MSAIAAMGLNDGQATPVSHTFSPVNIDSNGIAKWADRSGGIALGYPTITFSMRQPSKASRAYKVTAKIVTPVLEVTSPSTASGIQPAPTLAYNLMATVEFVLPERSTLAQRKDVAAYLRNLLISGMFTQATENFENVY